MFSNNNIGAAAVRLEIPIERWGHISSLIPALKTHADVTAIGNSIIRECKSIAQYGVVEDEAASVRWDNGLDGIQVVDTMLCNSLIIRVKENTDLLRHVTVAK